jgi:pimeloyl-ACP methyl ester carboxylesterase
MTCHASPRARPDPAAPVKVTASRVTAARVRRVAAVALLVLGSVWGAARADVAMLIPGYLSSPGDWRSSGVVAALEAAGWRDGGDLRWGPQGLLAPGERAPAARTLYTVSLPTEAPLALQARVLAGYVAAIGARHAGEGMTLVGHSAGGVVARLFMVQNPRSGVGALITIASPHLGTETAEIGALLGRTPLAWFAPLLGAETLNRSQGLYQDLSRENSGGILFWLNRQPHPQARYVAIVRAADSLLGLGDLVVPSWSQDLNNVLVLRGRATRILVENGHGLSADDGPVLVRVLEHLRRS